MTAFTRSLGRQSGVQLNQVIDATGDGLIATNTDQIAGIVAKFQRGRIDRAFKVDAGNLTRRLGASASIAISKLNEAYTQLYDALNNGTYEAVVSRLVPAAAVNNYMVFTLSAASPPVGTWSTSPTVPVSPYGLCVQHLECHNDGVTIQVNAIQKLTAGSPVASDLVRLQIIDNATTRVLNGYDFTGSLNPASVDEFGASNYLPNVVSALTENVTVLVGASWTTTPTTSAFYGNDVNGNPQWNSANLNYFTEGGTVYANTDYDAAINRLRYSDKPFGYLMSGGTQNTSLLTKLIALGSAINVQVPFDIDGTLSPAAAITFYNTLGINTRYAQAYWTPLLSNDPLNGGKFCWGSSGTNVAYRCARNAATDSNGLAPKNYPVAGAMFPLSRVGVVQTYSPTDQELDALAASRINPVIFVRYNDGSRYVFFDSLTGAPTDGATKLINVTEMATHIDDWVTLYAQRCLQLPMTVAIKRMNKFLTDLFAATDAAGWTTPSATIAGGKSNTFTVAANNMRPFDRMDVSYGLHYDGTNRATYVQQTVRK